MLANFDRKEHLQHRAVSLRQHGFLVDTGGEVCVLPMDLFRSFNRSLEDAVVVVLLLPLVMEPFSCLDLFHLILLSVVSL